VRIAAAITIFLVLICVTPPAEPRWRLCPFHWLTGLDCPLCGLTRALFALAKGRWVESARFHALAPLAVAMLAALLWRTRWTRPLWTAGIGAFALYGVIRLA
jgi:Protein of unknown function (DUF2752)